MSVPLGRWSKVRSPKKEAARQSETEAERTWHDFPNLPGTHLSFRHVGERRYWDLSGISELVAADGSVLGTREWAGLGGRWLKVVIKVQDRTYRWQRLGHKIPGRHYNGVSELVAVEGEESVLRTEGLHFSYKAGTRVTLSDKRSFALPVSGRNQNTAVMSAVDDSGHTLLLYRLVPSRGCVEVVLSPAAVVTPEAVLLILSTVTCLSLYFKPAVAGNARRHT